MWRAGRIDDLRGFRWQARAHDHPSGSGWSFT